ncbi:Glycerol kinase [Wickerhamomyces ciferrii]|uniref:Glycerol kinase n=1 Tax=Wickerhamomyces ciferrii (strain ATCC 14091 / BCRC 22168 / CBS 111 / JCM 3599 / NBRC 0793 / NRRL Y-1031 F-60-10) TaxID=1206466 RepID=K0KL93_WICCF|nr:Glycerol kinase [Wickerhamomyces ciferrii]CCH42169.1 Glycerol kinase [Wickerhamomyces ciferrii]
MKYYHVGVDVGSSSIRVAFTDSNGVIVAVDSENLDYTQSLENPKFVTQSSEQILQGYDRCINRINDQLKDEEFKLVSIGVAATCSMVVMERTIDGLVPYPVDYGFKDSKQNIVFWMDSRAEKETKDINDSLKGDKLLNYHGGAFIEEMGLPKIKWLIDNIPNQDLEDIVFFELYDFITFKLSKASNISTGTQDLKTSDTGYHIAMDGSIKGWDLDLLKRLDLDILSNGNFKAIGRLESSYTKTYLPIPDAGSLVYITEENLAIGHGVIDCYAGWIASCGKKIQNTLTMIAGTSTCFLVAHNNPSPSPGIWGPYNTLISELQVSEGGQSTTGKLIEHLFETHPAFKQIESDPFTLLEDRLTILEAVTGESAHFKNKDNFLYGDLSGNRTPYADGSMRGVFIGESTDISLNDLTLKYLCILEFLAFQTKQVLESLKGHDIGKVIISGSQAKNLRFVKLLAMVTGLPVEVSKTQPGYSGVKGAAYLGIAAFQRKSLLEIISNLNEDGVVYEPEVSDPKLVKLLEVKYRVMKDMAERQRDYRNWVSKALE